jgi:hypothetical protein
MACLNVKHDNKVVVDKLDIADYKAKKIDQSPVQTKLIMDAMKQFSWKKKTDQRNFSCNGPT